MEKEIYYPICPHCGSQELPMAEYENQDDANKAAMLRCDCPDAARYQNIVKIESSISQFQEYCEKRGTKLEGNVLKTINDIAVGVYDEELELATIKFSRFTAKLNKSNKGNIVIAFTYGDGMKIEVE